MNTILDMYIALIESDIDIRLNEWLKIVNLCKPEGCKPEVDKKEGKKSCKLAINS